MRGNHISLLFEPVDADEALFVRTQSLVHWDVACVWSQTRCLTKWETITSLGMRGVCQKDNVTLSRRLLCKSPRAPFCPPPHRPCECCKCCGSRRCPSWKCVRKHLFLIRFTPKYVFCKDIIDNHVNCLNNRRKRTKRKKRKEEGEPGEGLHHQVDSLGTASPFHLVNKLLEKIQNEINTNIKSIPQNSVLPLLSYISLMVENKGKGEWSFLTCNCEPDPRV